MTDRRPDFNDRFLSPALPPTLFRLPNVHHTMAVEGDSMSDNTAADPATGGSDAVERRLDAECDSAVAKSGSTAAMASASAASAPLEPVTRYVRGDAAATAEPARSFGRGSVDTGSPGLGSISSNSQSMPAAANPTGSAAAVNLASDRSSTNSMAHQAAATGNATSQAAASIGETLGHWAMMVAGHKSIVLMIGLVSTAAWIGTGGWGTKSTPSDPSTDQSLASSIQESATNAANEFLEDQSEVFVNLNLSGLPNPSIPQLPKVDFGVVLNSPMINPAASPSTASSGGLKTRPVSTATANPLKAALQEISADQNYGLNGPRDGVFPEAVPPTKPAPVATQNRFRESKTPRGISDWTVFLPPLSEPQRR